MFGDDLETILELLEGDEAMEEQFVSAVSEVIVVDNELSVADWVCFFLWFLVISLNFNVPDIQHSI
ncbi:hypothetical protein OS493_034086 [Desmophyllum pertusum]|uniref:Uncharacterized protein n=1 Tax=Desmophyllum pertusum TaxID=174260 RepID=A0A9W9YIP7_9CNID|nr:hypothetical protein OS493_034086 [Desmophyllum pertusum]